MCASVLQARISIWVIFKENYDRPPKTARAHSVESEAEGARGKFHGLFNTIQIECSDYL